VLPGWRTWMKIN